jgi:hypothetical protein
MNLIKLGRGISIVDFSWLPSMLLRLGSSEKGSTFVLDAVKDRHVWVSCSLRDLPLVDLAPLGASQSTSPLKNGLSGKVVPPGIGVSGNCASGHLQTP